MHEQQDRFGGRISTPQQLALEEYAAGLTDEAVDFREQALLVV
ncbi:MAG: hypothetical protein OXI88_15495 [Gammaproteobacteria bacterium]|nr:hypothetical protein [Gammaproteobacteria bacterium]